MKKIFSVTIILLFLGTLTWACTDFRLKAKDDTVIVGRSFEFGINPDSKLRFSPKGEKYVSKAPDGENGMSWTSKYNFLYLDAFGDDIAVDGINEKGLAVEMLYFPVFASYQTVPVGQASKSMHLKKVR